MTIKLMGFALGMTLMASTAWADTQVNYRCDNGKSLTIKYESANNFRYAYLTFAGSARSIKLENQGAGSGSTYANDKWEFSEHHGESLLTDISTKTPKDISCSVINPH